MVVSEERRSEISQNESVEERKKTDGRETNKKQRK